MRLTRSRIARPGRSPQSFKLLLTERLQPIENKEKNMKKKRRQKPINVPITRGLVDELGQEMHFALLGMQLGDGSFVNWERVAKVLLTLSMAADGNDRVAHLDKTMIDAALLVFGQIADRHAIQQEWRATESELPCLCRGVLAAERALPVLDYRDIARACKTMNTMAAIARVQ